MTLTEEATTTTHDEGHPFTVRCPSCQIVLYLSPTLITDKDGRGEYTCHGCGTTFLYSPFLDKSKETK
jgi:hypothetical protein